MQTVLGRVSNTTFDAGLGRFADVVGRSHSHHVLGVGVDVPDYQLTLSPVADACHHFRRAGFKTSVRDDVVKSLPVVLHRQHRLNTITVNCPDIFQSFINPFTDNPVKALDFAILV